MGAGWVSWGSLPWNCHGGVADTEVDIGQGVLGALYTNGVFVGYLKLKWHKQQFSEHSMQQFILVAQLVVKWQRNFYFFFKNLFERER